MMPTPQPFRLLLAAAAFLLAAPVTAQMQTVDPNSAMQQPRVVPPVEPGDGAALPVEARDPLPPAAQPGFEAAAGDTRSAPPATTQGTEATYQEDDIFGAAEGVFGKGAKGLAQLLEKVLKQQGRPNAYIEGREAGGAFVAGLRYGSGTMHHKVEGDSPVYWTGPSLGLDIGGNGAKTFVLVYNLYDTAELYKRFPAAEGNVYVVGGFTASYMRRGDVVVIPIRLGVGWRLGANVGYMRFSKTAKWSPF